MSLTDIFRRIDSYFGLAPLVDVDVPNVEPATDWDAIRDGIAELRTILSDALDVLDRLDPTPLGLAQAASVTRITDKKRQP